MRQTSAPRTLLRIAEYPRMLVCALSCCTLIFVGFAGQVLAQNGARSDAPRIMVFSAVPTIVDGEQWFAFYWEVVNAKRVRLFEGDNEIRGRIQLADGSIGWPLSMSGSMRTKLTRMTTYELVAEDRKGQSVSKEFTVKVELPVAVEPPRAPRIVSFRVSPARVRPGEFVKFYWDVENADSVKLFDDIGELDFRGEMESRVDGWYSQSINKTTTFRLLAKGRDGRTVQDTFVVRIAEPAVGQSTCGRRKTTIANHRVYPLGQGSFKAANQDYGAPPSFGDTEMGGNNPRITIEAAVREQRVGRHYWLVLEGGVEMVEQKGDRSSFFKSFSARVARIPDECTLREPTTGRLRANAGNDNHAWTWYGGKGIIRRARCRSDTKGNDKGKLGCDIEFRPILLSDR